MATHYGGKATLREVANISIIVSSTLRSYALGMRCTVGQIEGLNSSTIQHSSQANTDAYSVQRYCPHAKEAI